MIAVTWRDCWFDFERPAEGWRDDYLVTTVGYVVREDEHVLSLAQELLLDGDGFRAITHIPVGAIVSRVHLGASAPSLLERGAGK
jgi:hypothetical protein